MPLTTPNILEIVTDDQEYGTVVADQMPFLTSNPHGSWVELPNAVLSTPWCGPARASLLTGQRFDHTGQNTNSDNGRIDEDNVLPIWLQQAGYATAHVGKYLNEFKHGSSWQGYTGTPPGYDYFAGHRAFQSQFFYDWRLYINDGSGEVWRDDAGGEYLTDVIADLAVAWLANAPEPWFCRVWTTGPHDPSTPPPRYEATSVPSAESDPPDWNHNSSTYPTWLRTMPAMDATEQDTMRALRLDAARSLLAVDDLIEDVVGQIETNGQLGRTVIWFQTDNALANGRKRLNGASDRKTAPYYYANSALARVRWPGVTGRTDSRLVTSVDLPATWVALAGADAGRRLDGTDISAMIEDAAGAVSWRTQVESGYNDGGLVIPPWWSLRTVDGEVDDLYVEWSTGEVSLHDRTTDPYEQTSVHGSEAELVAQRSGELAELIRNPTGDAPPRTVGQAFPPVW